MERIEVGEFHRCSDRRPRQTPAPRASPPSTGPSTRGASTPDGTVHVPTGAFLVRGPDLTILVDAGLGRRQTGFPAGMPPAKGDPTPPMGEGGDLLTALAKAGAPA